MPFYDRRELDVGTRTGPPLDPVYAGDDFLAGQQYATGCGGTLATNPGKPNTVWSTNEHGVISPGATITDPDGTRYTYFKYGSETIIDTYKRNDGITAAEYAALSPAAKANYCDTPAGDGKHYVPVPSTYVRQVSQKLGRDVYLASTGGNDGGTVDGPEDPPPPVISDPKNFLGCSLCLSEILAKYGQPSDGCINNLRGIEIQRFITETNIVRETVPVTGELCMSYFCNTRPFVGSLGAPILSVSLTPGAQYTSPGDSVTWTATPNITWPDESEALAAGIDPPNTVSYQWQRNPGSGWVNIGSATNQRYSRTVSLNENGDLFRCVVTADNRVNQNGFVGGARVTATSSAVTLYVTEPPCTRPTYTLTPAQGSRTTIAEGATETYDSSIRLYWPDCEDNGSVQASITISGVTNRNRTVVETASFGQVGLAPISYNYSHASVKAYDPTGIIITATYVVGGSDQFTISTFSRTVTPAEAQLTTDVNIIGASCVASKNEICDLSGSLTLTLECELEDSIVMWQRQFDGTYSLTKAKVFADIYRRNCTATGCSSWTRFISNEQIGTFQRQGTNRYKSVINVNAPDKGPDNLRWEYRVDFLADARTRLSDGVTIDPTGPQETDTASATDSVDGPASDACAVVTVTPGSFSRVGITTTGPVQVPDDGSFLSIGVTGTAQGVDMGTATSVEYDHSREGDVNPASATGIGPSKTFFVFSNLNQVLNRGTVNNGVVSYTRSGTHTITANFSGHPDGSTNTDTGSANWNATFTYPVTEPSVTITSPSAAGTFNTPENPPYTRSVNGLSRATVVGGIAPFTYAWSHSITANEGSALVTGSPNGETYTITATDSQTAFVSGSVTCVVTDRLGQTATASNNWNIRITFRGISFD